MRLLVALLFAVVWSVSPPLAPLVLPEPPRLEAFQTGVTFPL